MGGENVFQRPGGKRRGKEREPLRPEDYEALHADFPAHTYATLWAVVHEFPA